MTTTEQDFTALRGRITGTVICPGDADYDQARSVWNGDIDRRPAVIARCANANDVAEAVTFARQSSLEISVRGGGHSYAGNAVCDGGLMIDLSAMRTVTVDPEARRARAGGGATWADLDAATQEHALAVPGGFISHTGIGGLTLGGGMGWLTNKHGLSCDNLVGAEVVTADGSIVRASADENPDLFWALRGGGGNFGVVTTFEYQLHPVGPLCQLGLFMWDVSQGVEVMELARRTVDRMPEEIAVFVAGLSAPPAPFVPEELHFRSVFAILVTSWGSPEEHAELVAPLREELMPLVELVTPIPYVALQQMFDESAPWGILAYEKAVYLDEMTDEAIAVIAEHVPRKQSPLSLVPMFTFNGAFRRNPDEATAFGGSRSMKWTVNISASAPDPELMAVDRAWVHSFWEALRPLSSSSSYVNFMSEIDEHRVRSAYGDKYERLAIIKGIYDPHNVFHFNANIQPKVATS